MVFLKLFIEFFLVGLFSFGGGYAAVPLISDVVESNAWMSSEQLTNMIAVAESTPGPLMVNLATYVGSTQGGVLGALIATIAVTIPSFVILLVVAMFLKKTLGNKFVNAATKGLQACVSGVILATGITMILESVNVLRNFRLDIKALIILISLYVFRFIYRYFSKVKLSAVKTILVAAVLGVIVYAF
ncbi:chromate transporter [Fastidiosipila sanguinis]|uniref:Chromate transporter n=1 Tax=Fastidiosipila sanguinis TaxID=236753 RepID=A0A2S0KNZ2_9FIRM|nr:chromate transporter [Fastidiosipila sanguinis]AVM42719.1 chromate transporter [Fastidiosipila sanguinis]